MPNFKNLALHRPYLTNPALPTYLTYVLQIQQTQRYKPVLDTDSLDLTQETQFCIPVPGITPQPHPRGKVYFFSPKK